MSEKNDHRLVEWDQIDFIKGLAASLGRVLLRSAWTDVVAVLFAKDRSFRVARYVDGNRVRGADENGSR